MLSDLIKRIWNRFYMFDITEPQVPEITAENVKKSIDAKEGALLLDVRTAGEYLRGKIEGSINIPVDEVTNFVESVVPDKSHTIYVYCLSGARSVHAVSTMVKLGYTRVYNMINGLLAWRAKGYPVEG